MCNIVYFQCLVYICLSVSVSLMSSSKKKRKAKVYVLKQLMEKDEVTVICFLSDNMYSNIVTIVYLLDLIIRFNSPEKEKFQKC